jgi:bilirubin oxidase
MVASVRNQSVFFPCQRNGYSDPPFMNLSSSPTSLNRYLLVAFFLFSSQAFGQYNPLWIPDTLAGPNFNLTIKDTLSQIRPGQQTITGGINSKFWGPTLIFHKGDTVRMNVKNKLNESTTIHWHGMHLPAVMDGGPHQVIPAGTTWQPYWKVQNHAATYWYHPHLHEKTMEHITKGIGGLIIVRDEVESALALPRTYGVDDIPVILTDRDFTTANQFSVVPYGDSMVTNGVLRAGHTVPAQVVRFRILNAAIERSFNIGFNGLSFSIICSDGGLLNAPVTVNRYILHAGERVEILVNFTGKNGQSFDMKAYNSTLTNSIAGGENFVNGPFGNALGRIDFNMLHLAVGAPTANAITTMPSVLTTNVLLNAADATVTRKLSIIDSTGVPGTTGPNAFVINHKLFNINYNQYEVPLGNTEIWEITSTSGFGHPFHIHDVEFNILSVNGAAPADAQKGWKDVVFVPAGTRVGPPGPGGTVTPSVVKFIAKFDDFADIQHPFMYHCHISLHEDEGMMGQFVVKPTPTAVASTVSSQTEFQLFPNPANDRLFISFANPETEVYYIKVINAVGRVVLMLPRPELKNGISLAGLPKGVYALELTDARTKVVTTRKFIRQ